MALLLQAQYAAPPVFPGKALTASAEDLSDKYAACFRSYLATSASDEVTDKEFTDKVRICPPVFGNVFFCILPPTQRCGVMTAVALELAGSR
jgi:hypothetical protein